MRQELCGLGGGHLKILARQSIGALPSLQIRINSALAVATVLAGNYQAGCRRGGGRRLFV